MSSQFHVYLFLRNAHAILFCHLFTCLPMCSYLYSSNFYVFVFWYSSVSIVTTLWTGNLVFDFPLVHWPIASRPCPQSSYSVGTVSCSSLGGGGILTPHLQLVPRSKTVELYLHSFTCLHDIVLNCIIKYRDNFIFHLFLLLFSL
jgi:hypothetical protein